MPHRGESTICNCISEGNPPVLDCYSNLSPKKEREGYHMGLRGHPSWYHLFYGEIDPLLSRRNSTNMFPSFRMHGPQTMMKSIFRNPTNSSRSATLTTQRAQGRHITAMGQVRECVLDRIWRTESSTRPLSDSSRLLQFTQPRIPLISRSLMHLNATRSPLR